MAHNIFHLIVFVCGLVWVIVDLLTVNKKKLDKKDKSLYIENKILMGVMFLVIIIMQIEYLCK